MPTETVMLVRIHTITGFEILNSLHHVLVIENRRMCEPGLIQAGNEICIGSDVFIPVDIVNAETSSST